MDLTTAIKLCRYNYYWAAFSYVPRGGNILVHCVLQIPSESLRLFSEFLPIIIARLQLEEQ